MKKLSLFFIIIGTIWTSVPAQNHKVYCKGSTSLIEEEGAVTKGKKEGYWKYYYCGSDNALNLEGNYENDKKVGVWKSYLHGYMYKSVSFHEGLENGEYTGYHETGEIKYKGSYKNGKLVGERKEFYEGGKIKMIENFSIGEIKSYYPNGRLEETGFYDSNDWLKRVGEWKEYYETGTLKTLGKYDLYKTGVWKEYYENGQLTSIGEMSNNIFNKRVGTWELYYKNGQVNAKGQYDQDGLPLPGSWITYDQNGQKDLNNCPEPTESQIIKVCNSIYDMKPPTRESGFAYKFHEDLWEMSCAVPGVDTPEEALKKIQAMWMKCREKFRCYKFIGVTVPDANVSKFSMDVGFSTFLVSAVKKYKLDMNFIDPADGKTIMDFLKEQEERYRKADSLDKADEYQRVYKILKANGSKHAREL